MPNFYEANSLFLAVVYYLKCSERQKRTINLLYLKLLNEISTIAIEFVHFLKENKGKYLLTKAFTLRIKLRHYIEGFVSVINSVMLVMMNHWAVFHHKSV